MGRTEHTTLCGIRLYGSFKKQNTLDVLGVLVGKKLCGNCLRIHKKMVTKRPSLFHGLEERCHLDAKEKIERLILEELEADEHAQQVDQE
jgi:hypothetical protein